MSNTARHMGTVHLAGPDGYNVAWSIERGRGCCAPTSHKRSLDRSKSQLCEDHESDGTGGTGRTRDAGYQRHRRYGRDRRNRPSHGTRNPARHRCKRPWRLGDHSRSLVCPSGRDGGH